MLQCTAVVYLFIFKELNCQLIGKARLFPTVLVVYLSPAVYMNSSFCTSSSSLLRRQWRPTPYSCLENPRDGGAWAAAVYGVSQNRTRLKRLSSSSSSIFSECFPSFPLYLFWWVTRISYCVHVVFPWLMRLKFSYMFIKNGGNSGGGGRISAGIASAAGASPPILHCRWGSQRWHWPSALMRTVILSSWRDRYQSAGQC